jgi:phosphoribosylformimino-5-aminoimidazole carboxamide ribotide isomerase
LLIPCIDLQGGQAVQLVHGRKRELAVADVFGLLESFQHYEWLHIIDLDAAMGKGNNQRLVGDLARAAWKKYRLKVRVGGGIRTVARAKAALKYGAKQVIVGSAALKNRQANASFLRGLRKAVGREAIVVALDTMKGKVVVKGWRRRTNIQPESVMRELEPFCAAFLCTDVDREGTMTGANLRWFRKLRESTARPIIAAGGISSKREIRALEKLQMDAAVGMALYKNALR